MTPSISAATPPARRRSGGPRPGEPYALVGPPRNEGHGKRLTAAFEALELFPALAESRNRVLALVAEERPAYRVDAPEDEPSTSDPTTVKVRLP